MTLEKQPDWISNVIKEFSFIMDSHGIPMTIFRRKKLREAINNNLPQEDTYQKGYQKGLIDAIEYIADHHREVDGEYYKEYLTNNHTH